MVIDRPLRAFTNPTNYTSDAKVRRIQVEPRKWPSILTNSIGGTEKMGRSDSHHQTPLSVELPLVATVPSTSMLASSGHIVGTFTHLILRHEPTSQTAWVANHWAFHPFGSRLEPTSQMAWVAYCNNTSALLTAKAMHVRRHPSRYLSIERGDAEIRFEFLAARKHTGLPTNRRHPQLRQV